MTNEERGIITSFIERISGARPAGSLTGSVPSVATALPPMDPEADSHIAGLFNQYPEARYRLTQTAFVQEHALAEAQTRIQKLEYDLQQARAQLQTAQPAPSRGFLGGLFGGGQTQAPPPPQYQPQYQQPQYQAPPQPAYAPSYQPGMFQRGGGSGFLGSALTTAAGVAGGMVAGNALMNLFSEHHGGEGGFGGGGFEGGGGPWGGAPVAGGWDNQISSPDAGASSGWDNVVNQPDDSGFGSASSGFDDSSSGMDSGGGWDDNST